MNLQISGSCAGIVLLNGLKKNFFLLIGSSE